MKARSGGLITTLPVQSTEWELSFKFKINSYDNNNFRYLFLITNGQVHPVYGWCSPLVTMYQTMLQNASFSFKQWGMALNTMYSIKISQYYVAEGKYRYTVSLDCAEVLTEVNVQATQFYNMQIRVLEEDGADCDITDLQFTQFL